MEIRDTIRSINWLEVEEELLNRFSNYRKIRVQFTRLGSICITAFPVELGRDYEIFTMLKGTDWSVERLSEMITNKETAGY